MKERYLQEVIKGFNCSADVVVTEEYFVDLTLLRCMNTRLCHLKDHFFFLKFLPRDVDHL